MSAPSSSTRRAPALAGLVMAAACGGADDGEDAAVCETEPVPSLPCGTSTDDHTAVRMTQHGLPAASMLVATHRADGSIIQEGLTDAAGCATLTREPGALVSVGFREGISAVRIVTTVAPSSGELLVHAPTPPAISHYIAWSCTPLALVVAGAPPPPQADRGQSLDFGVRLVAGCNETVVMQPPGRRGITSACAGSDQAVDVIVAANFLPPPTGPNNSIQPYAYAAGRAPVVDGVATLDVQTWTPRADLMPCPVTVDPAVAPLDETRCELEAGESIFGLNVPGLQLDRMTVWARDGERWVRKSAPPGETPTIDAGDFLPAIAAASIVEDAGTMTLRWPDVHAQVHWWSPISVVTTWDVLVPGDTLTAVLPRFVDPLIRPGPPRTAFRAHVDTDAADFASVTAGGLTIGGRLGLELSRDKPRTRVTVAEGLP
jgi:hypothetical protein